jgi:hypothetical protein
MIYFKQLWNIFDSKKDDKTEDIKAIKSITIGFNPSITELVKNKTAKNIAPPIVNDNTSSKYKNIFLMSTL